MPDELPAKQQPAAALAYWPTVLRAAEALRFSRVVDLGDGLWFCEFAHPGRLCRDIVVEPDGRVWTKEDADV